MDIFGIRLVGMTAVNGKKLLLTVVFVLAVILLGRLLRWLAGAALPEKKWARVTFWTRQGLRFLTTAILGDRRLFLPAARQNL